MIDLSVSLFLLFSSPPGGPCGPPGGLGLGWNRIRSRDEKWKMKNEDQRWERTRDERWERDEGLEQSDRYPVEPRWRRIDGVSDGRIVTIRQVEEDEDIKRGGTRVPARFPNPTATPPSPLIFYFILFTFTFIFTFLVLFMFMFILYYTYYVVLVEWILDRQCSISKRHRKIYLNWH